MSFWAVEPPADPYFDPRLNSWVVTRYRDVAAVLREPRFIPALARSTKLAVGIEPAVHADFRAHALRALSPAAIEPWEAPITLAANRLASAVPEGEEVDIVAAYARPFSLEVAGIAAGISTDECAHLAALSRAVFDSACEPFDEELAARSREATIRLAAFFREAPPWGMQMFIALAHSLPAFLGNAWFALLEYAVEVADMPKAMDELLRLAGPAKAQFRQAAAPVTIRNCTIARDQCAILRLDIANRDPDEFSAPHELRFDRRSPAHLAFGVGLHACVGAALIKSAAAIATKALFDRFHFAHHAAVQMDRFAVRYVSSLTAMARDRSLPPQDPNGIDSRRP
jgi:cytochrome P450